MITEQQTELMAVIRQFMASEGHSPSLHEMGDKMNLPIWTVRNELIALERLGYIRRPYGRPRSITVLKRPDAVQAAA